MTRMKIPYLLGTIFTPDRDRARFIGLVQAVFVLAVALPALPALHPRIANEQYGPTVVRQLEPPGFLGLHYGIRTRSRSSPRTLSLVQSSARFTRWPELYCSIDGSSEFVASDQSGLEVGFARIFG